MLDDSLAGEKQPFKEALNHSVDRLLERAPRLEEIPLPHWLIRHRALAVTSIAAVVALLTHLLSDPQGTRVFSLALLMVMLLVVAIVHHTSTRHAASRERQSELERELRQTRQELSTARRALGIHNDQSRALEESDRAVDQIRRALEHAAVPAKQEPDDPTAQSDVVEPPVDLAANDDLVARAAFNAIEDARSMPIFGYQPLNESQDQASATATLDEQQTSGDETTSVGAGNDQQPFERDELASASLEYQDAGSSAVEQSFDSALRSMADDVTQKAGTEVELNVTQEIVLTGDAFNDGKDKLLLLVAAEATSNIVQHSEATRVVIDLTVDDGSAVLRVVDDGIGFDAAAQLASLDADEGLLSNKDGLGFVMDQIIDSDGTFQIGSTPGEGTTIVARLPIF